MRSNSIHRILLSILAMLICISIFTACAGNTGSDNSDAGSGKNTSIGGNTESGSGDGNGSSDSGNTESGSGDGNGSGDSGNTEGGSGDGNGSGDSGNTEGGSDDGNGSGDSGNTEDGSGDGNGSGDSGNTEGGSGDGDDGNDGNGEADKPSASFDDIAIGTVVGKAENSSGGLDFIHEQRTAGSSATIVADPRGEGNALRFSKSDTATGDTLIFTPITGGSSCFVLEFDFCIESNTCSIPIQINLGSCYRLQIHVSENYFLIYDAKTNGSEKHFLGGVSKYGDWINIRVEYYPGDKTQEGQFAKVYFNGELAAISQNSAQATIYDKYTKATIYSLIASNATFYIDNVSAYSTNDTFADSEDNIVRIIHGEENTSDWDNRFVICEAILGKEITLELEKLCGLFDDDLYIWLANLYDPETGGFYYSNDGRDYEGFLPDIESTSQAMGIITGTGLGTIGSIYDDEMSATIVAWVQSLQSDVDGYFYHPQWGTDIGVGRLGRDLGNCISVLNRFGAKPLYPTALDRLAENASPTSLVSPLGTSSAVAVSKVVFASKTTVKPHLASEEAFIEYLDDLYATYLTIAADGTTTLNSYNFGGTLSSQAGQIRAAGLDKVCIEYLNAIQNPDTGLWEAEKTYRSASGLLKISAIYNSFKMEYPNADKAVRSAIDIASSEQKLTAIVYLYNPLAGLSNVLSNLKNYSSDENALAIRAAAINEMQTRAIELIANTYNKLIKFKKVDGSFSYNTTGAPAHSQGELVCFGANEGDVNGTALANGTISSLFAALGVAKPDYYNSNDAAKFLEIIRNKEPNVKLSVNEVDIDFETVKPETGLPNLVNANAYSDGAEYELITDTVYGEESTVIRLLSGIGQNDNVSVKFPTTLKDALCYELSADISISALDNNQSGSPLQLKLGSAYMILVYYTKSTGLLSLSDSSSTGSGNFVTDLGIVVSAGEWFNLKIKYYVGDSDEVMILVYINGELCAISNNYYGQKFKDKPLPSPAKTVNSVSFTTLMAAAIDLRIDNIHIAATTEAAPDFATYEYNFDYSTEGTVPEGVTADIKSSGGSAEVIFEGEDGILKFTSSSGNGDTLTFPTRIIPGEVTKYYFEAELQLLKSNNTTIIQLFLGKSSTKGFALDLVYKSGKISVVERTTNGSGNTLLDGISIPDKFTLRVEYYTAEGIAEITLISGGTSYVAQTTAYYSENNAEVIFTTASIYALRPADIVLNIDDLQAYYIIGG